MMASENLQSSAGTVEHPMLNHLILDNIFGNLEWRDLGLCRQVCKIWNERSVIGWLKQAPDFIIDNRDRNNFVGKSRIKKLLDAKEREVDDEAFHCKGVSGYMNFRVVDYDMRVCWQTEEKLWEAYGHQITKLTLVDCEINLESLLQLFSCSKTKNLKVLRLIDCDYQDMLETRASAFLQEANCFPSLASSSMQSLTFAYSDLFQIKLPIGLSTIFKYFPLLQQLDLTGIQPFNYDGSTSDLLDIVKEFKIAFPVKPLQSTSSEHVGRKVQGLKNFCIFLGKPRDAPILNDILRILQHNLCSLEVKGNNALSSLILPRLECLTQLQLSRFPVVNMSFLMSCPNLKVLGICLTFGNEYVRQQPTYISAEEKGWTKTEMNMLQLASMESFTSRCFVQYISVDIMNLAGWFGKNLTCLKMHLNDPSFTQVCHAFRKLKTLIIYDNMVSEMGLLGYHIMRDEDGEYIRVNTVEKLPNIEDLQDLEKLCIEYCSDDALCYQPLPPAFTEYSYNRGFSKLTKLRELYISPRLITMFGGSVMEKKFPGFSKRKAF